MYLVFATVKHLYLVNILWQGLVVPPEFMGAVQCSITRQRIFSESKMLFKYRSKENYKISPVKEKFLILVHILPKQASVLSVGTLNALIGTTALTGEFPLDRKKLVPQGKEAWGSGGPVEVR